MGTERSLADRWAAEPKPSFSTTPLVVFSRSSPRPRHPWVQAATPNPRSHAPKVRFWSSGWALALLTVGLPATACAQRLGPLTPLDSAHFRPGVTRRNEVANVWGLPTARTEDQAYEYWSYSDGPALASVDMPFVTVVPTGSAIATMQSVQVSEAKKPAIICVFGHDGVLIGVRDLRGQR